ncbi:hypothetical protein [Providencia stuartii]|uniref:hypothetical protein n=1 Tax=Providencia stuartii TaxID=588 RepID=UPI0038105EA9
MALWKHIFIPGYTMTKALSSTASLLTDSSSKPLSELEELGRRIEIESAAMQSQAKVEQELSIARRIMCAKEVEIEEFYDLKGSGSAGVNQLDGGVQIGISGEAHRVSRRIVKFKGFDDRFVAEMNEITVE